MIAVRAFLRRWRFSGHASGIAIAVGLAVNLSATSRQAPSSSGVGARPPYAVAGPLREPRIFGDGVISTADDEFGGSFTPDGKTIYFSRSAPHSYLYAIFESHWVRGKWTTPTIVPFSGEYTDSDPILSPDGNAMYWSSDRPVNASVKHDYDIWMVRRQPDGNWGPPERLPEPINSNGSEFCASVARNGTIYFSSTRDAPPGAIRAFRSRLINGKWAEPENLSAAMGTRPDDPFLDLDIMVDPDERFLLVGSLGRPDGFGHFDIYVSWNRDGVWSPLKHLPAPFNTPARDYSPHISPDGKYVFFASERGFTAGSVTARFDSYRALVARLRSTLNGSGNIYQIDVAVLDSLGK